VAEKSAAAAAKQIGGKLSRLSDRVKDLRRNKRTEEVAQLLQRRITEG
jgi:hypothetical protein